MALQFEAKKIALKQDRTGFILTIAIHPDEIPEELIRDYVGARYGCALVRIQDDESATIYKNRVQKAGILCREESFQEFMGVESEEAAAHKMCLKCEIHSRTELHGNETAKQIFDQMIKEYDDWRLGDDPFK